MLEDKLDTDFESIDGLVVWLGDKVLNSNIPDTYAKMAQKFYNAYRKYIPNESLCMQLTVASLRDIIKITYDK